MITNSFKTANLWNSVGIKVVLSSTAIVFSYLAFASMASAADYYATTGGSGSTCSSVSPCSLRTAVAKPSAGDTVHVADGTYIFTDSVSGTGGKYNVYMNISGTSSNRIRYVSDHKWGAKIVGSNADAVIGSFGNYVDIDGFDVSSISTSSTAEGIRVGRTWSRTRWNHVHDIPGYKDCATNANGGAGIEQYEYTSLGNDNETTGNIVHDIGLTNCAGNNGADRVQGIYHSGPGGLITNNIVYRVSGFGIHAWHSAQKITISNNLSFNNLGGGFYIGAGDSPGGITCSGMVVTNNMAINNGRYGIIESGAIGANTYNSNILYGNSVLNIYLKNGNTAVNTLNVAPSTVFVNYKADGSGDYHLSTTSPAINAGTGLGAPIDDFEGLRRMGSTYIGPLILVPPSNLHATL